MTGQSLTILSGLILLAVIFTVAWRVRRHRYRGDVKNRDEPLE